MSDKNELPSSVRVISKESIVAAIDLLQEYDNKRKKSTKQKDSQQISSYCINGRRRRKTSVIPFSKSLVMSEMRSFIARQDWRHIQNLFPLLVNYPTELEPLIWRYALMILLYSPTSSSHNVQEFLEMCIGCQNLDISHILERLLLLQDK